MVRKLVVVFTSVVLFAAAHAKALGLGEVTVESALNQPLAARIDLLQLGSVRPEQISVQLASESDFARFSIAREAFLNSIRFNVVTAGSSPYVRLSSQDAVREPYLSFVLETRWPSGRLLSEHTVLLDLPAFAGTGNAPAIRPVQVAATELNSSSNQSVTENTSSSLPASTGRFAAQEPAANEPAQADAADTAAAAAPLSENAGEITVDVNDTLWNIALEVRPDSSVTVQQTMLALQRMNSEAFISGNINMVRRGQVLRIPDLAQIRALSAREAISEVSRQNQLFENRRNVPLSSQPVTAQPSATAAVPESRGELTVVTTDTAEQTSAQSTSGGRSAEVDAQIADLEDALAVQNEEVDRVTLTNEELNERLSLLEQQIASAQEIIRLRDLELAQLQQSLAQEQATQAAAPEPVDPPTVITMAPEKSLLQRIIDTLIANTYILLAVTALIILLLVYLLLRRNKTAEEAAYAEMNDIADESENATSGVHSEFSSAGSTTAALADDEDLQEIFGMAEAADESLFADDEPVQARVEETAADDVLEQADVLIASLKYDEAVTLLQNAIVAEPERTDLRLKLLEVCVARQDAIGFKLQETELRDIGDASVGPRIAALKAQLKGELIRGELDDEILEEGEDAFLSELDALDDMEIALDMESSAEVDDNKVFAGTDAAEQDDNLVDFDFDFAVLDTEPAPESDAVPPAQGEEPDFTFDSSQFDLDVADEEPAGELEDLQFLDDSDEIDLDIEFTEDDAAEDDDFDFMSDADEVATKLDLAKAYFEMGDQEGAREILEEVLNEGNEAQVADAQGLLDKL